jgi:carbamoyl-phosphate synthase large subunit
MLVLAALRLPTVHWKIPGTHTVLDFKEIVMIGGGVVVVILLLVLLLVARRGSEKNAVKKLLSSPNPAERLAGVKLAAQEELGRHVRSLRRLSSSEKNPEVLRELAEVVARHQWEPSDDADVIELRIWAHRYYSERVPTRGPDVSLPRGPVPGPSVRQVPVAQPAPSIAVSPIPVVTMPGVAVPANPLADTNGPLEDTNGPVEAAQGPVETVSGFAEPDAAGAFTVLEAERLAQQRLDVQVDGEPPPPTALEEPDIPPPVEPEEPATLDAAGPDAMSVPPFEVPVVEGPSPGVVPEEPAAEPDEPAAAPVEPVIAREEPVIAREEPVIVPEEPAVGTFVFEAGVMPPASAGEKACILVTGAGGAAGVTVIRALMKAGHRVVAVDRDPLAVGLRLADASQMIPSADDPQFASFVCKLSLHQGVKGVISTIAEEMPSLSSHRELFDDERIATWFPERGVVQACIDKWLFHLEAKAAGLPVPPTNIASAEGVPRPWIVKPRFGRGSRDIMWVDTPEDLAWALGKIPNPLVQSRLSGEEFTVDALVTRDGTLAGAVPRWRIATRGGITTKGETFANDALIRLVENLLRELALRGAANVQGFVSREGAIMFTEVNPRFSGGLALSIAAGADLVGQYVNGLFGQAIDPARLRYRPGVRMLRYFDEVFEG